MHRHCDKQTVYRDKLHRRCDKQTVCRGKLLSQQWPLIKTIFRKLKKTNFVVQSKRQSIF